MENTFILRQPLFRWGIGSLIVSFILFLLPDWVTTIAETDGMGLFMIHYGLTIFYFFAVLFSGRFKKGRNGLPLVIVNLLLFLISAYALNRQMTVFNESVDWMQILLVVTSINLLVASLPIPLPWAAKMVQIILLTIAAIFYTYLAIYLIPMFAFGLFGALAVGIGLHAFVPLLLLVYNMKILLKEVDHLPKMAIPAWSTLGFSLLIIIIYSIQWYSVKDKMETTYLSATRPGKTGWPAWVETLQHIPQGAMANRVLKSDIVYKVLNFEDGFNFFEAPRIRWEETKKHDPLIVVASLFTSHFRIPKEDRIKMLQTLHDNRYGAEERLWSGDNLKTIHMNTDVQIWPAMHLAYAEKTITVANNAASERWIGRQQEAIYIFQLPEGAVVTSLSLWINGREEKSVLTTKGKAEKAYRTIVGVEVRDPSVVHWQEGNRVSVRVFPVEANNQRIFKIGVTIPLPERDGNIWYENFTFIGPDAEEATENVTVKLMESAPGLIQTVALKKQSAAMFTYTGKYNPDLSLSLPAVPLKPHGFVYQQTGFKIEASKPERQSIIFGNIYADVNAAWTKDEWRQLLQHAGNAGVYVYDDEWIPVNDENEADVFNRLQDRKMTMFPFYKIKEMESSLIVTKSAGKTPSIDEIRNSSGFDALVKAAGDGAAFYVYHIGEKPSLYISSLRELRMFHYAQGSLNALTSNLDNRFFSYAEETSDQVVIHNAAMAISRTDDLQLNNGPDHILRLFAYNHIMQQGGLRLLADSSLQEGRLAELASYAHIVTPVSSMVVLEQAKDYHRFDIDTHKKGLQNASAQNSGSVPEPHEWAIMIVCLLLLFYNRFQSKISLQWLKK
jgi:XrtN system VIT domain protein